MTQNIKFYPKTQFSIDINRAERSHQVRYLAPLLAIPAGRVWFINQLQCLCSSEEASNADVYHLCFPLRDIFTADYYQCRGNPDLEDQFISYYNDLFSLPENFGIDNLWRTAPNNEIRHPAAPGRAGWYEEFLQDRVRDTSLYERARDVRRMLGTEADVLMLTANYSILVECKYLSSPSMEQYDRHMMMGKTLAKRLKKEFIFGMVIESDRDPKLSRFDAQYVLWSEVKLQLVKLKR